MCARFNSSKVHWITKIPYKMYWCKCEISKQLCWNNGKKDSNHTFFYHDHYIHTIWKLFFIISKTKIPFVSLFVKMMHLIAKHHNMYVKNVYMYVCYSRTTWYEVFILIMFYAIWLCHDKFDSGMYIILLFNVVYLLIWMQ